jgi:hypothetical protein
VPTKYVITEGNSSIEFESVELATAYNPNAQITAVEYNDTVRITPPNVTPRQIRQALILSGVSISDIEAALLSLPEPQKSLAKTEWEYSIAFERDRPLVASVAQMLGWTPEQLDALWLFAGTL